ncbi:hypothetical protein D3C71_1801050 [compost metagenome]
MEQHALLHRRQRVDIFDLGRRDLDRIQLHLIKQRQREVRRRDAHGLRQAAMADQRLQFASVVIGQARDGGVIEHLRAEGPA